MKNIIIIYVIVLSGLSQNTKSQLARISFEAFPGFGACWNQLELLADKSLETKAFDLLVSNGTKTKYVSLKQKGSKKNLSKSHSAKSVIKKMQNVLKLPNMWFFSRIY